MSPKPKLEDLLDKDLQRMIDCLAARFASIYSKKNPAMISQEDLATEGMLATVIAYQSFDKDRGDTEVTPTWFRSHSYPYIRNAMMTYCKRFSHPLSISEKAARDHLSDILNIGIVNINAEVEFDIPTGSGMNFNFDTEEFLMKELSPFEKNLAKDYMINDMSLREIANKYNVSKSRAGTLVKKITNKLKSRAEDYISDQ